MSAYIIATETNSQLASTLAHYAEYGRSHVWNTKEACKDLMRSLSVGFGNDGFNTNEEASNGIRELAKAMYQLNDMAVCNRYGDERDKALEGFNFKRTTPFISPVRTVKALHCLLYQCSEGKVPEHWFFKKLEAVATALEHDIVTSLPEYDQAQWG